MNNRIALSTSRDAVETAIDRAKSNRSDTWEQIASFERGRIKTWETIASTQPQRRYKQKAKTNESPKEATR